MPTTSFDLYYDSSFFTSLQLQPRWALNLTFLGFSHWVAEHAVSFGQMIQNYQTSFAVVGIDLRYGEHFGFLDGDRLTTVSEVRIFSNGVMSLRAQLTAGSTELAVISLWCRSLRLDGSEALAAVPGPVPDTLLARFPPSALADSAAEQRFELDLNEITGNRIVLGESARPVLIARGLCEAADQWCFADLPVTLGAAREEMIEQANDDTPQLRKAASRPLRRLQVSLTRPLFFLDRATVTTTAYAVDASVAFVQEITGLDGVRRAQALTTVGPS